MRIEINGTTHDVADGISLSALIADLSLAPERIAIELNREVVRRAAWVETFLRENDKIEVVHFVGGGGQGTAKVCACA